LFFSLTLWILWNTKTTRRRRRRRQRQQQQQQQQQQPHRRYYPHNFNIYTYIYIFFHILQEKSNPHISPLNGCDDVNYFTSMSSETFEAHKMPKTVQRQYGQRTYVLFIFKRHKPYKFQVIRGSRQKFRNGLITFIFVIVCCCCLQSRPNSNSYKGCRISRTPGTLFRIACRTVSECS